MTYPVVMDAPNVPNVLLQFRHEKSRDRNELPLKSNRAATKMSFVRDLKACVTVEPVVFLFFVTMVFSSCLGTNLLLYKACDPTGATALTVGTKCADETAAQHVVAPINGWKLLVQQLVPVVLAMFAGTWSDRHGRRRRPLILLPIVGQVAADALSLYCTVRWSVSPAATAAMQAAALSLSGGAPMLFNGVNSHVADTTAEKWRTIKYGTLGGAITLGGILGMLVYGTTIAYAGFATAYLVCVALGLGCLALTFVFIDDVAAAPPGDSAPLFQDVIRTVNPVDVVRNSYGVLTKRRPGHDGLALRIVVLACAPLTCIPLEGEMSVMYLFLRYKFQWSEQQFGIFNVYQMTVILFGTLIALGVLSHKLRMDDALIGSIASVFDLLAAVALFLVSQPWQLYLIPPLELFRGATLSLTSSIASKCVEPDELGKMNSVKLLVESMLKGAFLPFYSYVYNHTFESNPNAFFFITIVLTVPLVFSFGMIYFLNGKFKSKPLGNVDENTKRNNEFSPINDLTNTTSYHI